MSASLIGRPGSSTSDCPPIQCRRRSRARASLRNRHQGPSIMWNNLWGGFAVRTTVGPSGHTISPHRSSREGHHSTARWNSRFLLSHLIPHRSYAAATSRVQRNSVPSIHIRCMISANRRAKASIAFFSPRCLAIFIAQALSQDLSAPIRSGLLRRALPASSHLRTVIFRQCGRSRPIDVCRVSVQTPPRPPWSF